MGIVSITNMPPMNHAEDPYMQQGNVVSAAADHWTQHGG